MGPTAAQPHHDPAAAHDHRRCHLDEQQPKGRWLPLTQRVLDATCIQTFRLTSIRRGRALNLGGSDCSRSHSPQQRSNRLSDQDSEFPRERFDRRAIGSREDQRRRASEFSRGSIPRICCDWSGGVIGEPGSTRPSSARGRDTHDSFRHDHQLPHQPGNDAESLDQALHVALVMLPSGFLALCGPDHATRSQPFSGPAWITLLCGWHDPVRGAIALQSRPVRLSGLDQVQTLQTPINPFCPTRRVLSAKYNLRPLQNDDANRVGCCNGP